MYQYDEFRNMLRPKVKEWQLSFYLFTRNALTRTSLIFMIILLLLAAFAPFIIPYPGDVGMDNHLEISLQAPSWAHWFGTDEMGRDLFSRILYGTRISIVTAVVAITIAVLFGSALGAIAGTIGGWVDEVIMRVCDAFLSFPSLLLVIATTALMGWFSTAKRRASRLMPLRGWEGISITRRCRDSRASRIPKYVGDSMATRSPGMHTAWRHRHMASVQPAVMTISLGEMSQP